MRSVHFEELDEDEDGWIQVTFDRDYRRPSPLEPRQEGNESGCG